MYVIIFNIFRSLSRTLSSANCFIISVILIIVHGNYVTKLLYSCTLYSVNETIEAQRTYTSKTIRQHLTQTKRTEYNNIANEDELKI